ncbi:hypothetical protein MPL3365_90004 [Mesorhizobium plurifarium]|uniref:Uncharacterized protein n=1 Tax=Mesorhizobium plurifarium TaxID=69974 RepID=A0A090GE51_MESPL|nr:hypothetical protein MPL3365_90004 [Mesorhizobium plurifarium]
MSGRTERGGEGTLRCAFSLRWEGVSGAGVSLLATRRPLAQPDESGRDHLYGSSYFHDDKSAL